MLRSSGKRRALALTVPVALAAALTAGCGGDTGGGAPGAVDASALGPANKATGSPVTIGLFNIEGGTVISTPAIGDAAMAAVGYANDHLGGLGGHEIKVVRCGDKADGASAAACANTFVQDKVAAVVAGQPATADQIVPVVLGAGIPWVGSSPAAASEITSPGAFFFGSGFFGSLAAWAQHSKDSGYRSVTIFGVDNPGLVATVDAVGKPLFAKAGVAMKLVTVPQGTADSTSQVQSGLTDKPDAVIVAADAVGCQSILTALQTTGSTVPRMVIAPCVSQPVLEALGDSGVNGTVLFNIGDPTGDTPESTLYRAIMQQYAPGVETTGITPVGYLSMLGFVRAVNAGGISGEVTPAGITAALRKARDVPLPIGDGGTFSCTGSALPTTLVKSTICTSQLLYTTYTGSTPGPYAKIDVAPIFG